MHSNKLEITEPLFYAQYAEAIILTEAKKEECEKKLEKAISLWKKCDDKKKILDNLVIIVAQKFCSIHRKPGSEVKKFVDEIDLFKFLEDDLEMYRKITQSMNYRNKNGKAIDILEKAEWKWVSIRIRLLNFSFCPDVLNKSLKNEYTMSTLVYSKNIEIRVQVCLRSMFIKQGGYSMKKFIRQ